MTHAKERAEKRKRRVANDLNTVIHQSPIPDAKINSQLPKAVRWAYHRDEQKAALSSRSTHGQGALERLLRDLERSDELVWSVALTIGFTEEEMDMLKAMIAQVVADHLAGMTPGNVRKRREHADQWR